MDLKDMRMQKNINDYVLESLFNNVVGPRHFVNKKTATQSLIIFTKMCHDSFWQVFKYAYAKERQKVLPLRFLNNANLEIASWDGFSIINAKLKPPPFIRGEGFEFLEFL